MTGASTLRARMPEVLAVLMTEGSISRIHNPDFQHRRCYRTWLPTVDTGAAAWGSYGHTGLVLDSLLLSHQAVVLGTSVVPCGCITG